MQTACQTIFAFLLFLTGCPSQIMPIYIILKDFNYFKGIFMKYILPILFFIFGCWVFSGCKTPPAKYTIQTSSPDVWAEQPTQNLTIKMEFTR